MTAPAATLFVAATADGENAATNAATADAGTERGRGNAPFGRGTVGAAGFISRPGRTTR